MGKYERIHRVCRICRKFDGKDCTSQHQRKFELVEGESPLVIDVAACNQICITSV